MATNNFESMNFDMPMIVGGIGEDFEQRKKDFEEANDGEYTQEMYNEDVNLECDCEYEDIKEYNMDKQFVELDIVGGYYDGFQWQVKWIDKYLDYEQIMADDFTEEDSDYYYGDSLENVRAKIQDELKQAREYLEGLKDRGYIEIYKYAQFSNGEAVYKKVEA